MSGPVSNEVDPDAVAGAARTCADVAAMSGGTLGEVATYLPGRRVAGVRIEADVVEVHIVARWGAPLPEVASAVRRAVTAVAHGRSVAVSIDDIEDPTRPPSHADGDVVEAVVRRSAGNPEHMTTIGGAVDRLTEGTP